ncbi:DUF5908 family protein [Tenacibaculum sp. FZY0031]|uniref:DUF5908 family protein n=1 Tax=unclassified Tenacibaculum TaxID=2635139 RepID=UPI002ECA67F0|nr:DUF5908 family protein [Tenacibaculum sp. FZY0031]
MPVEIRELVIKTQIITEKEQSTSFEEQDFNVLKEELMEMCKRMLTEGVRKTNYRR